MAGQSTQGLLPVRISQMRRSVRPQLGGGHRPTRLPGLDGLIVLSRSGSRHGRPGNPHGPVLLPRVISRRSGLNAQRTPGTGSNGPRRGRSRPCRNTPSVLRQKLWPSVENSGGRAGQGHQLRRDTRIHT